MSVWIEIHATGLASVPYDVTLYMSVWIEMRLLERLDRG